MTLLQFFSLCQRGATACAFSAGDPKARYYALLDRARRQPIVVAGRLPLTFADIVGLTLSALYDSSSWPFLAQALQDLDVNSGSAAADGAIHELVHRIVGASPIHGNSLEAFLGVACSDTNNPRNPFVWPRAAANQNEQSPFFGSSWTWLSEPCSTWPARDRDRYTGPFNHATSTPVLVVGNFYDPATPYQGAQAVADMLPGSRLLSLDGWGHTSLGQSRCIDSYVTAYLLRQELPPPGTVCPPDTVPFSTSLAPNVANASAAIATLVPAPILRATRRLTSPGRNTQGRQLAGSGSRSETVTGRVLGRSMRSSRRWASVPRRGSVVEVRRGSTPLSCLHDRARRRMIILVSADPPAGGWWRHIWRVPTILPGPKPAGTLGPWAASIADDLRSCGRLDHDCVPDRPPCRRHLHRRRVTEPLYRMRGPPDGPDAHVDRRFALSGRGWESVEAYRSRWGDRRVEFIVELLGRLKPRLLARTIPGGGRPLQFARIVGVRSL